MIWSRTAAVTDRSGIWRLSPICDGIFGAPVPGETAQTLLQKDACRRNEKSRGEVAML
jgi:hypothetical protein